MIRQWAPYRCALTWVVEAVEGFSNVCYLPVPVRTQDVISPLWKVTNSGVTPCPGTTDLGAGHEKKITLQFTCDRVTDNRVRRCIGVIF